MRQLGRRGALAACLALWMGACRPGLVVPPPIVDAETRIAVLPFRVNGDLDERGAFRASSTEGTIPETLGEHVARQLTAELRAIDVTAIDIDAVMHATPPAGAAIYDTGLANRVGRSVRANYVVIGAITRYREREGTAVGVESPASVAYRAVLVDVRRETMSGTYRLDYTQQPLADDLTQLPRFIQGKFGWLTRQEILDGSLTQTARQIGRTVAQAPGR